MARGLRSRAAAAICVAPVLIGALGGCAWPGGEPDRTDVAASAAPAAPIAGGAGADAQCSEDVFWGAAADGSMPTSAEFSEGFEPADALSGFSVLCSASWTFPQNDCQMRFARAYIDGGDDGARLDEIDTALTTWATDRGLQQTRIDKADNTRSFGIDVDPEDGAVMTLLQWHAVSRYEGQEGVQRHADLAGIPLDGADVSVAWQVCPVLQGWELPPAP